ncbi:MAG: tyrosine-type recombinase/integrase [Chloroflexales bacterium]
MTDLIPTDAPLSPRLQLALVAWLDAHHAAPLTVAAYRAGIQRFRAALQRADLDLDGAPGLVSIAAQRWAAEGEVAAVTFNKRLATVSSFYRYAIQRELLSPPNPIDQVRRRKTRRYQQAQPLDIAEVRRCLAAIPRADTAGRRDYALLSVALATGRRLAELAGLRWGHVRMCSDGRLTLTWIHCKGGKVLYDTLPPALSRALLAYLHQLYGTQIGALPNDAPVWVSVSNHRRGGPLSMSAIADICGRHLGTSKVHQLRHTFARRMIAQGATITDVQRRLGHESAAATAIYIETLQSDENPFAEDLVRELGLEG